MVEGRGVGLGCRFVAGVVVGGLTCLSLREEADQRRLGPTPSCLLITMAVVNDWTDVKQAKVMLPPACRWMTAGQHRRGGYHLTQQRLRVNT